MIGMTGGALAAAANAMIACIATIIGAVYQDAVRRIIGMTSVADIFMGGAYNGCAAYRCIMTTADYTT